MKQFTFLASRGPAPAFHEWLLEDFAPLCRTRRADVAINLVTGADVPWNAVLEVWADEAASLDQLPWPELDPWVSQRAVYDVTELVGKNTGPERGWPTPGVKLIVPWIGRGDVTSAEQRRHWDEHVALANRIHVGVSRYVRNWIEASASGSHAPPYTGIATQHFLTEQDLRERSFDSPASVKVIEDDVADFLADHVVLQTVEYYCPGQRKQYR